MFHNTPLSFHALANSKPTRNGIEKETNDALRQDAEEEDGRITDFPAYSDTLGTREMCH